MYNSIAAKTGKYLGTVRVAALGQSEDSGSPASGTSPKRFVWNMYNRVRRAMVAIDTTDSWTYTIAAYRSANASNTNRLEFILGLNEDSVEADVDAQCAGTNNFNTGIGLDRTNGNDANIYGEESSTSVTTNHCNYDGNPGIGYHFLQWVEYSRITTGTTTFYGDAGIPTNIQSGIRGTILG